MVLESRNSPQQIVFDFGGIDFVQSTFLFVLLGLALSPFISSEVNILAVTWETYLPASSSVLAMFILFLDTLLWFSLF